MKKFLNYPTKKTTFHPTDTVYYRVPVWVYLQEGQEPYCKVPVVVSIPGTGSCSFQRKGAPWST
jgi:hypothetical protein